MTADVPYRLSIGPEAEAFRPEIEYACDFLDRCYPVVRAAQAERVLHYGSAAPPGSVAVPGAVFPRGVRASADGLHPVRETITAMEGRPLGLLPPRGDAASDGRLGYDALGLVFCELSRLEERDPAAGDRYGRFPIDRALAWRAGTLLDPLADRAALDLARAIAGGSPRSRTSYDVLLTHDVDRIRGYHRAHEPLRNALGDVLKRGAPGVAWRRLRVAYLSGLPWSSFREIMDIGERYGHASRFYFMGPTLLSNDSPYVVTMPALTRKLASEVVARGHVVGFHPGYATFDDPVEWRRQKEGLESVIEMDVREGRQHTLRYDTTITPGLWEANGMEMDCTPSYPERTSFRPGTCRAYHGYDLIARRPLRLRQHATAVMDFGLFGGKYRDLSIDEALAEVEAAASVCRRYGGTLAVLYHVGHPLPPEREFYRRLVPLVA